MTRFFTPLAYVDKTAMRILISAQVTVSVLIWLSSPSPLLPTPMEVWSSLGELWYQGIAGDLITSFMLNVEAIFVATIISLILSYSTVMPFFRPIVQFIGKLRFLSIVGLVFLFELMATSGHELKLSLLVFSIVVFFVVAMESVMKTIPKEQYDLARVLHMGPWRVTWEVVILGQFDKVFDVIEQNAAMSWMMLTMVESVSRQEGGIGATLTDQNKHFRLAAVFGIQIIILIAGILQDIGIQGAKRFFCNYAFLGLEPQ